MGEPPPEFEGVHAPTMHVNVNGHATQDWPMRPHAEASTPAMHLFVVGSQQPPQFEELHWVLLTGGGAEHELTRAIRAPLRMRAENRMNVSGHVEAPNRVGIATTDPSAGLRVQTIVIARSKMAPCSFSRCSRRREDRGA